MADTAVDLAPDIQGLVTEDDTPADNIASEKHQRLLTEALYSSWDGPGAGRPFLAAANVGVFALARNPAIVPDIFLSLDVEVPHDWWQKAHRSYLLWEFGKPPDVVIEIVSNTEGGKQMRNARHTPAYASSTTSSMTPAAGHARCSDHLSPQRHGLRTPQ
jgi:hypothetical protein